VHWVVMSPPGPTPIFAYLADGLFVARMAIANVVLQLHKLLQYPGLRESSKRTVTGTKNMHDQYGNPAIFGTR